MNQQEPSFNPAINRGISADVLSDLSDNDFQRDEM